MIWLLIFAFLLGALLAQRFKVMILLPAAFLVALITIGAGVVQMKSWPSIVVMIGVATVVAQLGYLAGCLLRQGLGAVFPSRFLPRTTSARLP